MAVILTALPLGPQAYGAIMVADYFPIDVGLTWEYTGTVNGTAVGGTVPATATIETTANQSVHSINTTPFNRLTNLTGDPGNRQFFSVTSSGLNFHREEFNFLGDNSDFEQVDNAVTLLPAMVNVGDQFTPSVTYHGQDPSGSWTGTWNLTIDVNGFEQVVTPLGTYQALKVTVGNVWNDNDPSNGTSTNTVWLAEGIGRVRLDHEYEDFFNGALEDSGGFSFLLTATNAPLPEPTSLVILGLGGLLLLQRRNRCASS